MDPSPSCLLWNRCLTRPLSAALRCRSGHSQRVQLAPTQLSAGAVGHVSNAVSRTSAVPSKRTMGGTHVVLGEGRVVDGELRDFAVEGAAGEVVRAVAQHDGAVHRDGPAAADLEVVLRRCQ